MKPLWSSGSAIQRQIESAKRLLVCVDYDGTLTSLRDHPSQVRLPQATRAVLERLARCRNIRVALVSGRRLRDLTASARIAGVCYVGNHGLELAGPGIRYTHPRARTTRPLLRQITQHLEAALQPVEGAWVEHKGLTLSVHYRNIPYGEEPLVRHGFDTVVQPYVRRRQVRVTTGKEVLEVRPPVQWTKGTAVRWLLARWRASAPGPRILPIYLGDDASDEDAFAAIGARGVTIVVGAAAHASQAQYRLHAPDEVQAFLEWVLGLWRRKEEAHGGAAGT